MRCLHVSGLFFGLHTLGEVGWQLGKKQVAEFWELASVDHAVAVVLKIHGIGVTSSCSELLFVLLVSKLD